MKISIFIQPTVVLVYAQSMMKEMINISITKAKTWIIRYEPVLYSNRENPSFR